MSAEEGAAHTAAMASTESTPEAAPEHSALGAALGTVPSAPWPEDATRDRLIGDWHFWQRRGGHRTSTDDLLTAWWAARCWSERSEGDVPERYLDIGCGIGSVLLSAAHRLRPAASWGVEAQAQSSAMAARSVAELPPGAPRITVLQGDLRTIAPAADGAFDLVTGSPPYLPLGTGVPSPDPQRFACRFETRGGVEAYCAAAARLLRPGGLFALVFQSTWHERVVAAASHAGLHIIARADVRTRSDAPADFLRVYAMAGAPAAPDGVAIRQLSVRDGGGAWTPEWRALRVEMSIDPA